MKKDFDTTTMSRKRRKNKAVHQRPQFEELEPRILYSADLAPQADAAADVVVVEEETPVEDTAESPYSVLTQEEVENHETTADAEPLVLNEADNAETTTNASEQRLELVFIDDGIVDPDAFLNDLNDKESTRYEPITLSSDQDGLEQILNTVSQFENIDAIHFVTHGDDASIKLGNLWVNEHNLQQFEDEFRALSLSLSEQADLLFYGCDIAESETGQSLIETIGQWTGADVAASDDITGHRTLGGDWDLEHQIGQIEAEVLFSDSVRGEWIGTLAVTTFQQGDANGYAGSQDTYLDESNSSSSAAGTGATIAVDLDHVGGFEAQGLIRFDSIFGNGANQIPLGSTINSASLTVEVTNATASGTNITLHRMLVDWNESTSSWDSLGAGLDSGSEYIATASSTLPNEDSLGSQTFSGLATDLQAWSDGGNNYGWAILTDSINGWGFESSESGTVSIRPLLTVDYTAPISQTFTVTNTNDSGAGSLRQAILDANANSGVTDTIQFNISGTGPHVITLTSGNLPVITDSIFIDGWSEPDYASDGVPVIEIDGNNTAGHGLQLSTGSSGSTIRGITMNDMNGAGILVYSASSGNWIYGNYIGVRTDGTTADGNATSGISINSDNNIIGTDGDGSNDTFERNVIGGNGATGVKISGATGNTVAGNYIGVGADGTTIIANTFDGIRLQSGATNNTLGGDIVAERNVIAGNGEDGIQIDGDSSDSNTIQNNYIGVSADGTTNIGNGGDGIFIRDGADNNQILDNWITGADIVGIEIDGNGNQSSGNVIQGNRIGTDITGTFNWGSGENGILLENNADNNIIGGINAGEGNIIAFSGQLSSFDAGILVESGGTGNTIRGNSIYSNDSIGIDLSATTSPDESTPNDSGDGDSGGNNLQNWAVITSAGINDAGDFAYDIDTTTLAAGLYTVDFYASSSRDKGLVEGERYLGTLTNVANGNSSLTGTLSSITLAPNEYVTLTVTDASGNTSEFSNYAVAVDTDAGGTAPNDLQATETSGGGLSINHDGGNDTVLAADDGGAILGGLTQFTMEFQYEAPAISGNPDGVTLATYTTPSDGGAFYLSVVKNGANEQVFLEINSVTTSLNVDADAIFDGGRHSIALTWDQTGGTWEFFLDGVSLGTQTGAASGQTLASGGQLYLGMDMDDGFNTFTPGSWAVFNGTLYDVRVFDTVRSDAQIATSYRATLPHDESNLIANWRFDDLSMDGVVTDAVGGNNLTIRHVSGAGFSSSDPELTFSLNENALAGTVVGTVTGTDAEREALIASLLAADTDLHYNAETGKFYKTVNANVTWTTAQADAQVETLNGVTGQLPVIRSATENEIVHQISFDAGLNTVWLGGSDQGTEGEWRWYSGNTPTDQFWQGLFDGYSVNHAYQNWDRDFANEPNDSGGGEDYLRMYTDGGARDKAWDDGESGHTGSYLVEWDADDVLDATQALTYSITSQTVAGAFTIDADSGQITVADGSLLDYETNATHSITVRTTDVDTNTYDEVFTISLTDLLEVSSTPTDLSSGIELNTDGGNDAYLITNNAQSILGGLGAFTFESSFVIDDSSSQQILLSYDTATQANALLIELNTDGTLQVLINNDSETFSSQNYMTLLGDGQQHHLAVTWQNFGRDISIYVDGEFIESVASSSPATTTLSSDASSAIVFGQEQDSVGGGFSPAQIFSGTLYDIRIWDHLRTTEEIALNYQQKFDTSSLPSGLIANWQMDGFNGSSEVVDVVSANNLSIGHAVGAGFVASTPVEDLHINENATDGASVGYVMPSDPEVPEDVVSDGKFNKATDPGAWATYTSGQSIGDWTVSHNEVDFIGTYISPPEGSQFSVQLNGVNSPRDGGIEQTLTTVAGQQYQIIFETTGDWTGDQDSQSLRVSADGTSQDFTVDYHADWSTTNPLWQQRSMTFTAMDASTVLNFSSLEGDTWDGPLITNIRVIEIPAAITTILNNDATLSYDAGTGKFYRVETGGGPTFQGAIDSATAATLNGVNGQLVTIASDYENQLVYSMVQDLGQDVWIGASDRTTEGDWYWLNENSDGEFFFDEGVGAVNGAYEAWIGGTPSNTEDAARMRLDLGEWESTNPSAFYSHIVEWDASEVLSNYTFTLTDDAGGRFAIDSNTGEITVADTSLIDYETATSHSVTVEVTDAGGNTYNEAITIAVDNGLEATQTVPGAQSIDEDQTLTFSSGDGNAITVDDTVGTADSLLQLSLSANDGVLTLAQTTGLTFVSGSDGSSSFVVNGTETNLNAALEGMTFTPDANFNGAVTLNVSTALAVDLEGHYTFEGGSANDQAAGTAQDGLFVGGANTTTDGQRGEVLNLDAAGEYVRIDDLYGNPTDVTLAAWVNFSSVASNGGEVISLGNDVALRINDSSEGVVGFFYDGATHQFVGSNITLSAGEWHHVAFSFDDANDIQTLYIDGEIAASGTFSQSINWTGWFPQTTIGTHADLADSSFDLQGKVDDARVYTRALSADEISALAADKSLVSDTVAITVNAVNDAPYFTTAPTSDPVTIESGLTGATSIAAVDLDNDGDMDLVSTTNAGELRWHENDGSGNYSAGTLITTQEDFAVVKSADFDGDGDMDLVAVNDDPADLNDTVFVFDNQFIGSGSVSFTMSSQEGSGGGEYDGAQDVVIGDVDGDGRDDFVVTYYQSIGNSDIVLFEQNAPGVWTRTYVDAVNNNYGLDLADTDGDGDLDIVAGDFQDDELRWYENDGAAAPNFTRSTISSTSDIFDLALGDIDGDGDQDIVYITWGSDDVGWMENDGTATTFTNHMIEAAAGGLMYHVDLADVNGDGNLDLVVAAKNGDEIRLYENDGTGQFSKSVIDDSTNGPVWVDTADVDGDGNEDIVFASQLSNHIGVHSNQGSSTWIVGSVNEDIALGSLQVQVADDDIAAGELEVTITVTNGRVIIPTGSVTVTAGASSTPTITFTGTVANVNTAMNSFTYAPDADFNGLGEVQVVVSDQGNTGGPAETATKTFYIDVLPVNDAPVNTVPGTQTVPEETATAIGGISIADVDAGALDLTTRLQVSNGVLNVSLSGTASISAGSNGSGDLTIQGSATDINATLSSLTYTGNTDVSGTAADTLTVTTNDLGNTGSGGAQQDVDNIQIDITAANDAPTFDINTSFTQNIVSTADNYFNEADAVDFDGDGDIDLMSVSYDSVSWWENDGSENFTQHVLDVSLSFPRAGVITDLDGDGDADILAAGGFYYTWYENDGIGNFTTHATNDLGFNGVESLAVADIDGDGDNDFVAPTSANDWIFWLENDGSENFTRHTFTTNVDYPVGVTIVDLNEDGEMDILSASRFDDRIAWYENDGTESFTQHDIDLAAGDPWSVSVADLDADGDRDVVATSSNNNAVYWYENDGSEGFTRHTAVTDGSGIYQVEVTDIDADGDLDLLTTSLASDTIAWHENDGSENFTTHILTTTADYASSATAVDVDGDGNLDIVATSSNDDSLHLFLRNTSLVSSLDGNPTYTEGGAAVVLDYNVQVTDAELSALDDFAGATLTLARNGGANAEDVFSNTGTLGALTESGSLVVGATTIGTITTNSGGTLVLTFNSNATNALVDSAMQQIAYSNSSDTPPASVQIDWTFDDGNGGAQGSGGALSVTDSTTINITAVNDTPVVSGPGSAYAATENVGLTIQGTGFTVADVDAAAGTMTATLDVGEGALTVAVGNSGATLSSGNGTGTVVLTGTLSQIDNLLTGGGTGTITYLNSSDTPSASTTLTVTVNDGGNTGSDPGATADGVSEEDSAAQTINITATNDDPTNAGSLPTDVAVTEDVSTNIDLSAIDLADVDAAAASLTLTLSTSTGGQLSAAAGAGITIGGSATALTLTGSLADLNTYLDDNTKLSYVHGTAHLNGNDADTISVVVNDNGNTGSGGGTDQSLGTVNVDITAVNDEPSFTTAGNQSVAYESGAHTVAGFASPSAGGGADESGQTFTYTVTNDNNALFSVQPSIDASGQLTYTVANGQTGTATVTVSVTDSGGTANGGDDTSPDQTFDITIAINTPPTITPIADQSINEDGNTGALAFTVSDAETAAGSLTVTAASSDQALIPDANLTLVDLGSGNWTITATPLADQNGSATITVTVDDGSDTTDETFVVTVNAVNDTPVVSGPGSAYAATENVGLVIQGTGFTVADVDAASGTMTATLDVGEGALTVAVGNSGATLSSGNGTGTVVLTGTLSQIDNLLTGGGTGTITYLNSSDTPSASTTLTVTVNDGGNTGSDPGATADGVSEEDSASQTINITATNDDPTNAGSLPTDVAVTEDVSTNIDLSLIDLADVDAGGNSLTVTLSTATGGNLSAAAGTGITVGGSGTATVTLTGSLTDLNNYLNDTTKLSYLHSTPHLNGNDADTVTVVVNDNGNTGSGGGTDQSLGTVNVDITAVNDEPSFTTAGNQSVAYESGAHTVAGFASPSAGGGADESGQTFTYTVSNDNNALFSVQPSIDASGQLTYTVANGQTGTATVTVSVTDSGGTANGGDDASPDQSFDITIAANTPPTITPIADQSINEDGNTGALAFTVGDAEAAAGSLTVTAASSDQALIPDANLTLVDLGGGNWTITATPAADMNGSATITVTVDDGTTTTDETFVVTVNAVNDEPSFTTAGNQSVAYESGAHTVAGFATPSAGGGADESGQTFSYTVSNDNNGLFSVQPSIDASGQLTYTVANGQTGTATVTVSVTDSGGTANGGDDTSPDQTFDITVSVNTPPTITPIADQSINEDGNTGALAFTVGDAETPAGSLTVTAVSSDQALIPDANLTLVDLGSGNWTITATPLADQNGSATITVTVDDGTTTTDETFVVTVNPVNDAPTDIAPVGFTRAELIDTTGGLSLGNLSTSDVDVGDTHSYTITGGPDGGKFSIGGAGSDELILDDGVLDFESQPSYSVVVTSTDSFGATVNRTITVTVTDVNEAPTVSLNNLLASLAENTDTSSAIKVADIVISDDALGTNTLSLAGADSALFEIVGSELRLRAGTTLDHEAQSAFDVGVRVDDAGVGGSPDDGVDITLIISDVNEFDPVMADQAFNIAENSANGSSVGTVLASDADTSQFLTFNIIGGNTGSTFSIDPLSGEIQVNDNTQLDAETNPVFSLTVEVNDSWAPMRYTQATITISVDNINDLAPEIDDQTVSIAEDASAGTSLIDFADRYTAGDTDRDGDIVSYSVIAGNDQGLFNLDPTSGVITLASANLDFESASSYVLTVQASDGTFTDTATLTIAVENVNEAPSVTAPGTVTVDEDVTLNFANSLSISDPDAGNADIEVVLSTTHGVMTLGDQSQLSSLPVNQSLDYFVLRGSVSAINAALSGLSFSPNADFNGDATLAIQVDDLGNSGIGSALQDSATVQITVNPVNDEPALQLPDNTELQPGEALRFTTVLENLQPLQDIDSQNATLELVLDISHASLSVEDDALLPHITSNTGGSLSASGDLDTLNQLFNALVITPDTGYFGELTLDLTVNDLGGTGVGSQRSIASQVSLHIAAPAVPDEPDEPLEKMPQESEETPLEFTPVFQEPLIDLRTSRESDTADDFVTPPALEIDDLTLNANPYARKPQSIATEQPLQETSPVELMSPSELSVSLNSSVIRLLNDLKSVDGIDRLGIISLDKDFTEGWIRSTDSNNVSITVRMAEIGGAGLVVGSVVWLLKGSSLVSSLLVSYPAWRGLDPLPVLLPHESKTSVGILSAKPPLRPEPAYRNPRFRLEEMTTPRR